MAKKIKNSLELGDSIAMYDYDCIHFVLYDVIKVTKTLAHTKYHTFKRDYYGDALRCVKGSKSIRYKVYKNN